MATDSWLFSSKRTSRLNTMPLKCWLRFKSHQRWWRIIPLMMCYHAYTYISYYVYIYNIILLNDLRYRYLLYTSCLSNFLPTIFTSFANIYTRSIPGSTNHPFPAGNYIYINLNYAFRMFQTYFHVSYCHRPPRQFFSKLRLRSRCSTWISWSAGEGGWEHGSLEISKSNWWNIDIETCKGVLM